MRNAGSVVALFFVCGGARVQDAGDSSDAVPVHKPKQEADAPMALARQYLAGHSGNVISIATFGDELLCLPGVHGHENAALLGEVDATHLPAVEIKVTLRLRPAARRGAETAIAPMQR